MPTIREDRRPPSREGAPRQTDLDRQYRRIGISAVAAAAPYCSGAETKDKEPAERKSTPPHEDEAA
jgi:hypothetical protein